MLQPILQQLLTKRIVLASGSPRRQELMKNIGLKNCEICPSLFEENLKITDFDSYSGFVEETAYQKVLKVSERLSNDEIKPDLIIGADTMVTLNGKIYGKPKSPQHAFDTLTELVGKQHVVYTGVVIKYQDDICKFTESTKVTFGNATSDQINGYVNSGESSDKAGGYGIQGVGGTLIKSIDGDYFNVMGLPLYRLSVELCKIFNYKM